MKKIILTSAMCVAILLKGWGQAPPNLKDPLIHNVPDYANYVINLLTNVTSSENGIQIEPKSRQQIENEQRNDPEGIVEWQVQKTANITVIVCVTRSGHIGEVWYFDGVQVRRIPGLNEYFVENVHSPGDMMSLPFGRTGYPWTDWVAVRNYTGEFEISGKNTFGFKSLGNQGELNGPLEAYIDQEDFMPLWIRCGEKYYHFSYLPPPKKTLFIPIAVKEAKEKYDRAKERMSLTPMRNY